MMFTHDEFTVLMTALKLYEVTMQDISAASSEDLESSKTMIQVAEQLTKRIVAEYKA